MKPVLILFFTAAIALPVFGVSSVEYTYDKYGNCEVITTLSATNQVLEKSIYTYDAYRRSTSYQQVLASGPARQWNWYYDRYFDGVGIIGASAHTSKQWRVQVEPAFDAAGNRRLSAHKFDYNDQIIEAISGMIESASGAWNTGPDTELHYFSYDQNGNKKTFTDPRGRLTTYEYDLRNRLWKTIEPLNRITETLYDTTGNKTLVKFPDERTQQWLDYDGFGQAWRFVDERNNTTNLSYIWGPMKKLYTVTTHRDKDGGGTEPQPTTFSYNLMGRPTQVLFPDGSDEYSTYEFGQLKTFQTRKDQVKTIAYDARGREISHSWSGDAPAPGVSRSWDDANRLSTICNIYSTIDYGYDAGGLVLWEGNTIAGSGERRQTTYHRYPDGNVSDIQYPDGIWIHRDYTARGQLKTVEDSVSGPVINYTYFPDGKVDHADYGNGTTTAFGYDGRGMISSVQHKKNASGQNLSYRDYFRDTRDRIYAYQKSADNSLNGKENGRGDHYRYDAEGQLTSAWYDAIDPANTYASCMRQDHFDYDQMGTRRQNNHVARWGWTWFLRRDNGLNQYLDWGVPINHDGNGATIYDGWISATYNAINQPVSISSPESGGTMWFGYDPLGRCVKRWIGPSGAASSNPATYLYYNGWNLIQDGTSATSASMLYIHGGRVDEIVKQIRVSDGWERYFQHDARGNCILQTDGSGNLVEQYDYDAFGQPYFFDAAGNNIGNSPWGNRFLFTGREWLKDLWIYDYRNRMYHPELGRFLQPDPKHFAAGDYNLYRYCHNDPVNKRDPFGLQDEKVVREFTKNVPVLGSNIPLHIRYTESGNWNDTRIANHYDSNLKNRTGFGGTTKGVGSFTQSGHNIHIDLNVNWWVDSQYANTDAVARELQHVRDYRAFSNAFANSLDPNRPLPSLAGFPSKVVNFQRAQQAKYDPHLKIDMPHNLEYYPPRPFMLPTFENTANEIGH